MTPDLRAIVAQILQLEDQLDSREEAQRQELERKGYRLVRAGQTDVYGADGKAPWQVHDFRTGELLMQGRGGPDDMDRAWRKLWYSVDSVSEVGDDGDFDQFPADVPVELIDAIREHVTRPSVIEMYRSWVTGEAPSLRPS